MLDTEGVEFTISVPFERFTVLKAMIENRKTLASSEPAVELLRIELEAFELERSIPLCVCPQPKPKTI